MLYIYNLLQTFLYSDMQKGDLRGQKHSENLARAPQSPQVQSRLGGFKISLVGWGLKQEKGDPETIIFSAFRRPVLFVLISLSSVITLLLSGELRLHPSHPKKH